ncbi:hypothetical protein ACHAWF_004945 [Thalassiosira exigua]
MHLPLLLALAPAASVALSATPPPAGRAGSIPLPNERSARRPPRPRPREEPAVWDDVLPSEEAREALHERASASGLGHRCFVRPLPEGGGGRDVVERALDAILTEIDGATATAEGEGVEGGIPRRQYVEYWTRQEWRHIEAHADVDENLSKQIDREMPTDDDRDAEMSSRYPTTIHERHKHRYPIHGHVLYLKVGSEVRGPTCVFPGRSSGGDLLRPIADSGEDDAGDVGLVTVPAVPGRLLRFDGRDLHAVPRPSDLWTLPFVKGGAEYEPEKKWGRSVVLFNVWPGDEDPPLDVPLDVRWDEPLDEDGVDTGFSVESEAGPILCNPFADWIEAEESQRASTPSPVTDSNLNRPVKVWLLGNERRRDHPLRTLPLFPPAKGGREAVREALAEQRRVTKLRL